ATGAQIEGAMPKASAAVQAQALIDAGVDATASQAADTRDMQSESDSDTIVASLVEKQEASRDARAHGRRPEDEGVSSRSLRRMNELHARVHSWIQYEAMLGVVVLLCVALLAGLAGSLAPTVGTNASTLTAATKTPVNITQTADHLRITLKVTPDT